jgi:hypothetical protein
MDKVYEKNFVKPTDPNFIYDKRVEFKASKGKIDESWDDD